MPDPPTDYVDQCHLYYEIFRHPAAAEAARAEAERAWFDRRFEDAMRQYRDALTAQLH